MEDLQAEVQEMEFLQFSKGMDTMRREDFAEWLLHYTNEADNETYWENMRKKIPAGQVKITEGKWSFSSLQKQTDGLFLTEHHVWWVQGLLPVHQQSGGFLLLHETGDRSQPPCWPGWEPSWLQGS